MKRYSQISNEEKINLLQEFCDAISVLDNSEEIMNFITDLLSKQETVMIAKRIKIAKMLIEGKDYQEIQNLLKTSPITISKINQWLLESGEGFRIITERTKIKKSKNNNLGISEIQKLKKRYPIMFWPENLIKDVLKIIDKKEKDKFKQGLKKLDHKSDLYQRMNRLLK